METMTVRKVIKEFIFENFMMGLNENHLGDTDSFLEKGIIDSTGVLELVAFVEQTFGFEVADDELVPENFDSVAKLESYVQRKVSPGADGNASE
jgi:acyl carrier protein